MLHWRLAGCSRSLLTVLTQDEVEFFPLFLYKLIMADALEKPGGKTHYTYADYLAWEGPERYQLIYGEVYMMSSPSVAHQAILMELSVQLGTWLRGKPCQVFSAPLDVRLFPEYDNSDDTVVQPDLMVVCDKAKLSGNSVNGPPDLVIEIISPSTPKKEHFQKFELYLDAGVREYWVIEPEQQIAQVHVYEKGHFLSFAYRKNAVIPSAILPGFSLELRTLWAAAEEALP